VYKATQPGMKLPELAKLYRLVIFSILYKRTSLDRAIEVPELPLLSIFDTYKIFYCKNFLYLSVNIFFLHWDGFISFYTLQLQLQMAILPLPKLVVALFPA
jgi:hypothetical protein